MVYKKMFTNENRANRELYVQFQWLSLEWLLLEITYNF